MAWISVREMVADLAIESRHEDVAEAARRFAHDGVDAILALAGGDELEHALETLRREAGLRIQMVSRRRSQRIRRRNVTVEAAKLKVPIAEAFPLVKAAKAHRRLTEGHVLGEMVPTNPRTVIARDAASFIAPASKEKDQKLMIVMAAGDARRRFQVCSANPIAGTANSAPNWRATMKSDSEIERDVKERTQVEPLYFLDATDIGVSVTKGVVTLTGFVKSYFDKYEAETAAKRVAGVVGVANDIEVRIPSVDKRPDPDIARDAVSAPQGSAAVLVGAYQRWSSRMPG